MCKETKAQACMRPHNTLNHYSHTHTHTGGNALPIDCGPLNDGVRTYSISRAGGGVASAMAGSERDQLRGVVIFIFILFLFLYLFLCHGWQRAR